ncbi:MAG: hypothetical protein IT370_27880 [Deltaproteobacteria bacterium]|nr:hypothetical protein [Deltaproteobacteria bacterium]
MNPQSDEFSFIINLPVRNEWRNVDLLRTSVQNCFTAVFADLDGCHAVSMVTGELLENALKYGDWRAADPATVFRLRVVGGKGKVDVSVQNPIANELGGAGKLLQTLEWIASYPSAEAAYRARMLQIAQSEDPMEPSQLGLVRIAYEGNCALRASVDGAILTITATLEL